MLDRVVKPVGLWALQPGVMMWVREVREFSNKEQHGNVLEAMLRFTWTVQREAGIAS